MKFQEYDWQKKLASEIGGHQLGITSGSTYFSDPKRLGFLLARYKFVSKMFDGFERVLEVGCGDGFGSRVVRQTVGELVAFDTDQDFVDDCLRRNDNRFPIDFITADIVRDDLSYLGQFDGVYALDVFEHVSPTLADSFAINCCERLSDFGVLIVGVPSLESQIYASADVNEHVNCMSGNSLRQFFKKYFHNVFLFSMNDEVVHTGFSQMSHYNLVLCSSKK